MGILELEGLLTQKGKVVLPLGSSIYIEQAFFKAHCPYGRKPKLWGPCSKDKPIFEKARRPILRVVTQGTLFSLMQGAAPPLHQPTTLLMALSKLIH